MKLYLKLFFLFLLQQNLVAQEKYNHFKSVLDTTQKVNTKLSLLDSVIKYNPKTDYEEYTRLNEQYVALAIQNKNYERAIKHAIRAFHTINVLHGQPKRAFELLQKVEKYKNKTKNSFLLGSIYLKKGGGYFNAGNLSQAIENYSKAIDYFSNKDSIFIADAIYFKGQAYFDSGEHKKALDDFNLASKYYKSLGDNDYVFYVASSVINIYGANGFHDKAIKERLKLIKEKKAKNYKKNISVEYFNLGLNYKKNNQPDKQEESFLKALELIKEEKNTSGNLPLIYTGIVKLYLDKGDLNTAKKYLDLNNKIVENENVNTISSVYHQVNYSYYLLKTAQVDRSLKVALNTFPKVIKSGRITKIIEVNELLYKIYNAKNDKTNALKYFKEYSKIKDSIFDITKTNALAYYQTLYETEQKENEINIQKNDIKLLANENEQKQRTIILLIISALSLIIITYLFINKIQLNKKKVLKEEYAQKLLLTQEKERKRIAKDLHDGLGQSLLIIKNKINTKDMKPVEGLVVNAIEEMRSISRTLHPFQLENVGLRTALKKLINQLDSNYEDIYIFGDFDEIEHDLSIEQEVNIFRIIQEGLTNVIKHSKAESAHVKLISNPNQIKIIIKDNGVGFDFSQSYHEHKSLGLKTIKERVKFLNGSLNFNSKSNEGTIITIHFNLE